MELSQTETNAQGSESRDEKRGSLALLKMLTQSSKSKSEGRAAPAREAFYRLRQRAKNL